MELQIGAGQVVTQTRSFDKFTKNSFKDSYTSDYTGFDFGTDSSGSIDPNAPADPVDPSLGFGADAGSLVDDSLTGFTDSDNSKGCGDLSFNLTLSSPTTAAQQALAKLISFNITTASGSENNVEEKFEGNLRDKTYVSVTVQPTDDVSLAGTFLIVNLTGWQTLHPL